MLMLAGGGGIRITDYIISSTSHVQLEVCSEMIGMGLLFKSKQNVVVDSVTVDWLVGLGTGK